MQINKLISIYARVSTSNQEDEGTIQAQLMAVREFAEKNGYKIIEEFLDDGWSGDTLARPELDRLRVNIKDAKWEALLSYDPDRLARRYSYQELIKDEIFEAGKDVLFVTVPVSKNPEDKILNGVRGLFAEYERIKITERMRLGKLRKVKQGKIIGIGNSLYGYTYIPNSGSGASKVDGYYIVNEDEAKVVRKIFNWIAVDKISVNQVVKNLMDEQIKPKKNKEGIWATTTINNMLRNEGYVGKSRWGSTVAIVPKKYNKEIKFRKNKKTSKRELPKEEWLYVPIPPIITQELFDLAQERKRINQERSKRNRQKEYLLANLFKCDCGKPRTGESVKGGVNLYYRCTDRIYTFPLPRTCFEKSVEVRSADRLVWEKISGLMCDENLLKTQLERWMAKKKTNTTPGIKNISDLEKEVAKLNEQEDRYNKGYGAGAFTIEQLKQYQQPIRDKVSQLYNEIAKQRQHELETSVNQNLIPSKENIQKFTNEIRGKISGLSFEQKRSIIEKTVQKVEGTKTKITITGYIPININKYVEYETINRNCGVTKCGKVDAF